MGDQIVGEHGQRVEVAEGGHAGPGQIGGGDLGALEERHRHTVVARGVGERSKRAGDWVMALGYGPSQRADLVLFGGRRDTSIAGGAHDGFGVEWLGVLSRRLEIRVS